MADKKFPSPEEIQKEFENFVKQRLGGAVNIFTKQMNPGAGFATESSSVDEAKKHPDIHFEMKPKDIKNYLDRYIIRQDEAKKALAIAVCDHYNHIQSTARHPEESSFEYSKQNVLLLGPTGVGKTYLIRKIADLIGVPFVKADATRFSETGYVGANVDDLIRDLVAQADGDIERAQYGIVYLDEADKLATPQSSFGGRDVNGRGVQFGLLRLMEETEVDLRSGNDLQSQMQALMDFSRKGKPKHIVNTANILFIVSGAFTGLVELIKKRMNTNGIGFDAAKRAMKEEEDYFRFATTEDFVNFGFEPEFIGRLPVRVHCQHLEVEDLYRILKESRGSIVKQYVRAFSHYGIDLHFSDDALWEIARQAHKEKTGARALMTVCERALRSFKYELPSLSLKKFVVHAELIQNPERVLNEVIAHAQDFELAALKEEIREFEKDFLEKFQIQITFSQEASTSVARMAFENNQIVANVCENLLQSYEHGLKLVQQNTGQTKFVLSEEVVSNPQLYLEKMIRQSFTRADIPSSQLRNHQDRAEP